MLLHLSALLSLLTLTRTMDSGIVGGREVKPHSRPYMVSVQHNRQHLCGGMLIRKDFVLTAAHCLRTEQAHNPRIPGEVVLGAHNIKKTEPSQQRIQVRKTIRHPDYTKYTTAGDWKNLSVDIMLLKLKFNATLNKSVKVQALPRNKSETPADKLCTIAGWGMRKPNAPESDVLIETSLRVLPQPKCKDVWQQYYDSDYMMCTATAKTNTFCQGDSGGPLRCNSRPQGLAIYTYPYGCNDPGYPGVYLKISPFLDWIKEVMGKEV